MKRLIDHAIVLRRVNYSESDRVLTMLTKSHGKISVFARGARKQKSRLSGGIELLSISEIGYLDGKSELKTLTSANLVRHFDGIVQDIEKTKQVFEALKRIEKLCDENAGQEYYGLLEVYLSCLSDKTFDRKVVESWLRVQLLAVSGVLGSIEVEGDKSSEDYIFDYDKHRFRADREGSFNKDDIKLIRLLKSKSKPVRLNKSGSENRVLNFTARLLELNLT